MALLTAAAVEMERKELEACDDFKKNSIRRPILIALSGTSGSNRRHCTLGRRQFRICVRAVQCLHLDEGRCDRRPTVPCKGGRKENGQTNASASIHTNSLASCQKCPRIRNAHTETRGPVGLEEGGSCKYSVPSPESNKLGKLRNIGRDEKLTLDTPTCNFGCTLFERNNSSKTCEIPAGLKNPEDWLTR